MLRLGAGWSAERLSQEFQKGGAGELARTTIAKIERDIRPIKAGEVDGVARLFGLTANDLLDLKGPKVFLSYAEQDGDTGREVTAWLDEHGFELVSPGLPAADAAGPNWAEAGDIDRAQAFVTLLSPSFLSSPRCQHELDVALRRERQLLAANPDSRFIHVLQVTAGPGLEDSGLSGHLLIDLPTAIDRSRDVALSRLGGGILASAAAPAGQAEPPGHVPADQESLDRGAELERVLYALGDLSGAKFWLVTGPPGLGKSWLLERLEAEAAEPARGGWVTSMVDLRSDEDAARYQHDAMAVLGRLFDVGHRQSADPGDDIRAAAQKVILAGQPCLYLLDSAELLAEDTVSELRRYLGQINRLVQDSGRGARLAFVVASRRDTGWRGFVPGPALSGLRLGGFAPGVLQGALERLAGRMSVVHSLAELRTDAAFVQRVTEGVPELVLSSLQWIQDEQWLQIERLDDPQPFGKVIAPYIENSLLAQDSLLPAEDGQLAKPDKQVEALQAVLRALVPYRFITQSHVTDHLKKDDRLRGIAEEAELDAEGLWRAIADTALLLPLDEPWREIHPAIRRLLYRYFFPPECPAQERADVHARAREFTTYWARQLTGKEQINGMVEAIWHEAVRLRLTSAGTMGDQLPSFAGTLSGEVRKSIAYSEDELRDYAVQRMMSDDELRREVGDEGLFDRLILAVANPGGKHD